MYIYSTTEQLKKYVDEQICLHPEYKSEIMEFYQLCLDEIEEGGSVENECSLCESSIIELIHG
jgi:hypothetical protein